MLKKTKKYFLLLLRKLRKLIPTRLYSVVVSGCNYLLQLFIEKIRHIKELPLVDIMFFLMSIFLLVTSFILMMFFISLYFFIF